MRDSFDDFAGSFRGLLNSGWAVIVAGRFGWVWICAWNLSSVGFHLLCGPGFPDMQWLLCRLAQMYNVAVVCFSVVCCSMRL